MSNSFFASVAFCVRSFYPLFILLAFSACATVPREVLVKTDNKIVLFDPASELSNVWEHRALRKGETTYTAVTTSLGPTIRARGNVSASIFFRVFERIDLSCDTLEWSWLVKDMQEAADLRKKGFDDAGASLFVSFGDLGLLRDNPVPTIRYVWANKRHTKDDIIVGPYMERYVRTIVVRTGQTNKNELVRERRNLVEDFENAFGKSPTGGIYAIGLFTDNDDTEEPVTAYYGRIALVCGN